MTHKDLLAAGGQRLERKQELHNRERRNIALSTGMIKQLKTQDTGIRKRRAQELEDAGTGVRRRRAQI